MSARPLSPFLDLLKQIDGGVTIYEPFARTPERLREFADTVARLEEMKRLGLVRQLFMQTEQQLWRGADHDGDGRRRSDRSGQTLAVN